MEDSGKTLVIGSRESALAVMQAKIVMAYLEEKHPEIRLRLETMKTTGDRILDRRLDEIGGKGLFVKELDQALREGRIDLSVHSMKDMPVEIPKDLPVIGYSRREDPRDVLVLPVGIKQQGGICGNADRGNSVNDSKTAEESRRTAGGASDDEALMRYFEGSGPIGTSSGRRILQLREIFPNARFESVRGNVATRLRKLDEGQYGALILASAGLKRLGLENRISRYFEVDEVIPSAGQGILALQGRKGGGYSCLDGFCDRQSAFAVAAERAFVQALGGGCTSPIAAHAAFAWKEAGAVMTLRGFYYDEMRQKGFRKQAQSFVRSEEDCARAGKELAEEILGSLEEAGR